MDYINQNTLPIKFVIAPHTIKTKHIETIKKAIKKPVIRYSQIQDNDPKSYEVLIIDTIGLLTKIYSYANVAYVGGAFATGLHNTLEPAVFGIPVIIGPEYNGFVEAESLVKLKGLLPIKNSAQFQKQLNRCFEDENFSKNTGKVNAEYIETNKGATQKIIGKIDSVLD